jgi:hypothetical protein
MARFGPSDALIHWPADSRRSFVTNVENRPGNVGRSILAVFLGMVSVIALSLCTDQVFHMLNIYPPWGQPMWEPRLNALALSYRIVYGILGSYVAARLAPRRPMRHAMVVGGIGFVLSTLGVVGTTMMETKLGPSWYPISLAVTALPCGWLGGVLYRATSADRA